MCINLDWRQSAVTKYLKYNQNNITSIKAGHYSDQPL